MWSTVIQRFFLFKYLWNTHYLDRTPICKMYQQSGLQNWKSSCHLHVLFSHTLVHKFYIKKTENCTCSFMPNLRTTATHIQALWSWKIENFPNCLTLQGNLLKDMVCILHIPTSIKYRFWIDSKIHTYTLQSRFSDIQFIDNQWFSGYFYRDRFSIYYIKSFDLVTLSI